jgi:hypothetical protein
MGRAGLRSDLRIFVWCPKTAGRTLIEGMTNNPGVRWLNAFTAPEAVPAPAGDPLWCTGHTAFGQHLLYGAEPDYFTILRDPIERLISEFFYSRQQPNMFMPEAERMPAFIRYVEAAAHLNYYCYMFADHCAAKEAADTGVPAWDGDPAAGMALVQARAMRNGYLAEQIPFHAVGIDRTFRRATQNIAAMRFVAFFDQLEAATARLQSEFGMTVGLDAWFHVTPQKPDLGDLPAPVLAMLKRKTEADYAFYDAATRGPNAVVSPRG